MDVFRAINWWYHIKPGRFREDSGSLRGKSKYRVLKTWKWWMLYANFIERRNVCFRSVTYLHNQKVKQQRHQTGRFSVEICMTLNWTMHKPIGREDGQVHVLLCILIRRDQTTMERRNSRNWVWGGVERMACSNSVLLYNSNYMRWVGCGLDETAVCLWTQGSRESLPLKLKDPRRVCSLLFIFAVLECVRISVLATTPNYTRAKFTWVAMSMHYVEILVSYRWEKMPVLVIPNAVSWVPKLESNLRKEGGNLHVKMLTGYWANYKVAASYFRK